MPKSLDSMMSQSLKAAFGKTKAAGDSKASAGADASTGASNPFSHLLERVIQNNQPKSGKSEPKASKSPDKPLTRKDTTTVASKPKGNHAKQDTLSTEQAADEAPKLQTFDQTITPTTDTEPTLWDETVDRSSETDMTDEPGDTLADTDTSTDTSDTSPLTSEPSTDMRLLISLQQPMTLGLYQPLPNPDVAIAESTTGIEATHAIDTGLASNLSQNALTEPALPHVSQLSPLAATFALPGQASGNLSIGLSSTLPIADTLPLSQSSEIPSQGSAGSLDNGPTALPGTAFGTDAISMQASLTTGAIEIHPTGDNPTAMLADAQVPLEALSGQLEIPSVAAEFSTAMAASLESSIPIAGQAAPLTSASNGFENTTNPAGLTDNTPSSTNGTEPDQPLGNAFAPLLDATESLSTFGNLDIDANTEAAGSDDTADFEILPTDSAPAGANGSLPELSQATTPQQVSRSNATNVDSSIATFTSAAQHPTDQVADGAIYSIKQGQRELIIRLNPDNLGEVRINLVRHGNNEVSARLIASTAESHDLLQSQLDSLKQRMEAQGIQVERLSVVMAGGTDTGNNTHSQHQATHQQTDANANNPQQSSSQGQPDNSAFTQAGGSQFQQKQGTPHMHRPAFQPSPALSGATPDGTPKLDNRPQANANGSISILI